MNVSKPIGYVLIAIGLIAGFFGLMMMTSLPDNGFAILFGILIIIVALVLLGIGAIAAKK